MENYSIHLPSYSIGDKVYNKIPEICETYGKKIIAIGGHKAINAARGKIEKSIISKSEPSIAFSKFAIARSTS